MNSRPLSFSHGWAGRRIELRLTCNLQLQIVLPASSCFACLYQWEFETGLLYKNMSYSKSIQRYSYIPDIIIYTMYFFCKKKMKEHLIKIQNEFFRFFFFLNVMAVMNWNDLVNPTRHCFSGKSTKLSICHHMLKSSTQLQNRSFHVAEERERLANFRKRKMHCIVFHCQN